MTDTNELNFLTVGQPSGTSIFKYEIQITYVDVKNPEFNDLVFGCHDIYDIANVYKAFYLHPNVKDFFMMVYYKGKIVRIYKWVYK